MDFCVHCNQHVFHQFIFIFHLPFKGWSTRSHPKRVWINIVHGMVSNLCKQMLMFALSPFVYHCALFFPYSEKECTKGFFFLFLLSQKHQVVVFWSACYLNVVMIVVKECSSLLHFVMTCSMLEYPWALGCFVGSVVMTPQ